MPRAVLMAAEGEIMQNLKPLLEYQEVDITLRRALLELEKHPDLEKLSKTKQDFGLAKKAVSDSETAAGEVVVFYESAKKEYAALIKQTDDLAASYEKTPEDEVKTRQDILAQITEFRDKLSALEKKMADSGNKSKNIIMRYRDAQERGKKMKDLHGRIKERIDDFQKEKEPHLAALRAKLASLKNSVDAKLLAQYETLASTGKIPPLAESKSADGGKSYTCLGCGLALSQVSKSRLLESGFSSCDSCRRMIYKV